ncbi:MAG TPA: response regulator [Candidatus Polarisedimenticolia bacterium]|nr:response regulator [Candidatus Polarisedimenticolia bacterium]
MNDRLLTTSEVAAYCQVTNDGVVKWIKAKKLKAYSTPGGHYRIRKSDFKEFLERFGMPVDQEFFAEERKKILVVDDQHGVADVITRALGGDASIFHLITARDGYEAGLKIGSFKPDLIVLDIMTPQLDGVEVCKRIKLDPETEGIKVLALTGQPEQGSMERAYKVGVDLCMPKPLQPESFKKEVSRLLDAAS